MCDHSSNNTEDYGLNVHKPQPYLLSNYLEKLDDNKESFVDQRSKKKTFSFTKKVLFIHSLSLIQITANKKIYFFLVTIYLFKF